MPLVMETRPAAYSVIIEDGNILLAHYSTLTVEGHKIEGWTLPGGGMDPGEQPAETAVREAFEETGFRVETENLLGVHAGYFSRDDGSVFCAHRTIFRSHIVDGTLRCEEDGTTNEVRWVNMAQLDTLVGPTTHFFDAVARMMGFENLSGWAGHYRSLVEETAGEMA